jgi:hypothetical protein
MTRSEVRRTGLYTVHGLVASGPMWVVRMRRVHDHTGGLGDAACPFPYPSLRVWKRSARNLGPDNVLDLRGCLAQLVRAPALQAGGRRFESCSAHFGK